MEYKEREQTQRDNPYCSASPVTDGERVVVSFGSAGLYCYDFKGQEIWHREFGKMNHIFGNGSSPVLAGKACILNFGPDEKARLIAVDKTTGKDLWQVEPPKMEAGELSAGRGGGGRGPGGGGDTPGGGGRGPGGGGGNANNNNNSVGGRLAAQIVAQADKDSDKKVSAAEFNALPDAWYDKLDPEKTGKLQPGADFGGRVRRGASAGWRGRRRCYPGPSRNTAPAVFAASDADKDGSLTRDELKGTFTKWFTAWDTAKSGSLDQDAIAKGLDAAVPAQQGGGGGGAGGGGGRGQGVAARRWTRSFRRCHVVHAAADQVR